MKVIVGLGNPGEKYKNNRHNVGYIFIDTVRSFFKSSRLNLQKTNTFMNDSGEFVSELLSKNKVSGVSLYVVFDDLDIKLGEYKIQFAKGPKDHNGTKSIYEEVGNNEFYHVRIGVDNRDPVKRQVGEEYVLEDFSQEELSTLQEVFRKIARELHS